ncbi:hypothetical protein Tco_0674275 [Tanacetum coccineum]
MTYKAQQSAIDNALVSQENQRVIGKCNMRINPRIKPKEPTYQVVLDALALTTCYPAFLITAEVPVIYMHQFWDTVNKHKASYRFKIDNKRFFVNAEVFKDILNICPRVPGQEFDEPPTEEEALSFIRKLGHSGQIKYITDVIVDHLHQPWRTFASVINKCLCGKDKLELVDAHLSLSFCLAEASSARLGCRVIQASVRGKLSHWILRLLVPLVLRFCFEGECLFSKQYLAKIEGLSDVPKLKDATACHLKISNITPPAWKNHLDNYMDLELLDLHDCCYARKLLDRAQEEESEGLRAKCEYAMSDFEKNPNVVALREKISTLSSEVKEHKANLDRMMLESQKWAGYQFNLSHFGVTGCVTGSDKAGVVPYAAMELIHSDDLGSLVGKLVILLSLGECKALELGAAMKDPFASQRWKGYHSSYKK